MRSLYICLGFVVLTSATNGYDGSLMNGLQAMQSWRNGEYTALALALNPNTS